MEGNKIMDVALNKYSFLSFSKLYRFTLAEIVLYLSAQFGFLSVSAGNVFGQVGPAIMVCFGEKQLFEL